MPPHRTEDDELFQQRMGENDRFCRTLELYDAARTRALSAMLEARAALDAFTAAMVDLANEPGVSADLKDTVKLARSDMAALALTHQDLTLRNALTHQIRLYESSLVRRAARLRTTGKERVALQHEMDRLAKKPSHDLALAVRISHTKEALAAKDRTISHVYTKMRDKKERYVPLIMKSALHAAHNYMSALTGALQAASHTMRAISGRPCHVFPPADEMIQTNDEEENAQSGVPVDASGAARTRLAQPFPPVHSPRRQEREAAALPSRQPQSPALHQARPVNLSREEAYLSNASPSRTTSLPNVAVPPVLQQPSLTPDPSVTVKEHLSQREPLEAADRTPAQGRGVEGIPLLAMQPSTAGGPDAGNGAVSCVAHEPRWRFRRAK